MRFLIKSYFWKTAFLVDCYFSKLRFYLTTLVIKKFNFKGLRLLIAVLNVGANFLRRGQF